MEGFLILYCAGVSGTGADSGAAGVAGASVGSAGAVAGVATIGVVSSSIFVKDVYCVLRTTVC